MREINASFFVHHHTTTALSPPIPARLLLRPPSLPPSISPGLTAITQRFRVFFGAMIPAIAISNIQKTRRARPVRHLNKVVKFVDGTMIVGIRLRSGYVVDDPPSPPDAHGSWDVDLVDDEDVVTTPMTAAPGAGESAATGTAATGAAAPVALWKAATVERTDTLVGAGSDGRPKKHERHHAPSYKSRVKQNPKKSYGGCSHCSHHVCYIHYSPL